MQPAPDKTYFDQPRHELAPLVPATVRTVLDCGCGAGRLGELLRARGCHVTGIEREPQAAAAARQRLDRVIEGRVEDVIDALAPRDFDCVICADVLEHLEDPWTAARRLVERVRPGGVFLCSLPNVRHLGVLADLVVRGRWDYGDSGVLDRTHLRFFTRSTALALVRGAGAEIDHVAANREDFRGWLSVAGRCLRLVSGEFDVAQWIIRGRRPLRPAP